MRWCIKIEKETPILSEEKNRFLSFIKQGLGEKTDMYEATF